MLALSDPGGPYMDALRRFRRRTCVSAGMHRSHLALKGHVGPTRSRMATAWSPCPRGLSIRSDPSQRPSSRCRGYNDSGRLASRNRFSAAFHEVAGLEQSPRPTGGRLHPFLSRGMDLTTFRSCRGKWLFASQLRTGGPDTERTPGHVVSKEPRQRLHLYSLDNHHQRLDFWILLAIFKTLPPEARAPGCYPRMAAASIRPLTFRSPFFSRCRWASDLESLGRGGFSE